MSRIVAADKPLAHNKIKTDYYFYFRTAGVRNAISTADFSSSISLSLNPRIFWFAEIRHVANVQNIHTHTFHVCVALLTIARELLL